MIIVLHESFGADCCGCLVIVERGEHADLSATNAAP